MALQEELDSLDNKILEKYQEKPSFSML